MPETVIIRARRETRDLLRDLAKVDGETAIDTLEHVIREAAEMRLLKTLATDLSSVPERAEAESAAWDAALADGLDPDEDFSSWR
ncbi:MAG: hypothetical protein ACRDLF_05360 [Solirubrobacteraceae bacterium]